MQHYVCLWRVLPLPAFDTTKTFKTVSLDAHYESTSLSLPFQCNDLKFGTIFVFILNQSSSILATIQFTKKVETEADFSITSAVSDAQSWTGLDADFSFCLKLSFRSPRVERANENTLWLVNLRTVCV